MVEHLERLLGDPRLIVDTTAGRRPAMKFDPQVVRDNKAADLKRLMTEANQPDRGLQDRMPVGEMLEVTLRTKKWFFFTQVVGKIRLVCAPPMKSLLAGEVPKALELVETRKLISDAAPAGEVPQTLILVSTSGFSINAREAAVRSADRTVILAEPNDAGGWNCFGPVETKSLVDLMDPEAEAEKRKRIREIIVAGQTELTQGGIAADTLAARTQLPLSLIEAEVKNYAKENTGLAAKRLDGRIVLFREGSMPAPQAPAGGADMPLIDRIKSLFARKGETEKKIAFLSERRTALLQQRDRAYEDVASLEKKDSDLRSEFKASDSALARRRITSQLVQLRNDMERRQQMLSVLNQQINVVGTHLHNLELTRQGQVAKLPDGEVMAADAAAAEEMLAQLQADNELAGSLGTSVTTGMTDEEQALYEELEKEAGGPTTTRVDLDHAELNSAPLEPRTKAPEQKKSSQAEPG